MTEREICRPGGMELTQRMLDLANFPPGARLLDVCCGGGATVEMLLNAGFDAKGVDLDPEAGNLPVIRGSAYELPCGDATMDGIFCECGFSLLEPDAALAEFARVLKTGATLLLSDLYSLSEGARVGKLRVHAREDLESMLASHGFELRHFEDHTGALKSFLARQIMEYGSSWLREEFEADFRARKIKCGYCFLMARKIESKKTDLSSGGQSHPLGGLRWPPRRVIRCFPKTPHARQPKGQVG